MNRAELGERHHHVADNLKALAELHLQKRNLTRAGDYARQALSTYHELHGDEAHPVVTDARRLVEAIDAGR
jgi:hypothetical protein